MPSISKNAGRFNWLMHYDVLKEYCEQNLSASQIKKNLNIACTDGCVNSALTRLGLSRIRQKIRHDTELSRQQKRVVTAPVVLVVANDDNDEPEDADDGLTGQRTHIEYVFKYLEKRGHTVKIDDTNIIVDDQVFPNRGLFMAFVNIARSKEYGTTLLRLR